MPDQIERKPSPQFLAYIKQRAADLRANDKPPASREKWEQQKQTLRKHLSNSWGAFPTEPAPLDPRTLGELKRDGYRVEKIVFQTRTGIRMTANAYVPDASGRHPAVLCVHGHWPGAKQDPVVQARCIGLAKLGFFVLCVDAFGAGERGLTKQLGEYHGEMVAATLVPTGLALAGLQVYENMRAVDYLQSRPEVDPNHIGITGASGGGNQTMYAGAWDERFGCVVPTCSVGTYRSYIGAACCMCELIPGALSYTEEWGLLAMVAPRALMLINATRDAFQFSVGEAKKSLDRAMLVFNLYDKPKNARHAVFESKHDYNQPMREAMYGWMTLHLKGEGNGNPIAEPQIDVEDPKTLRCYPEQSRPEHFVTLPQFAAAEGRKILKRRPAPRHFEHWETESLLMTEALADRVLGQSPERLLLRVKLEQGESPKSRTLTFDSEPDVTIRAQLEIGKRNPRRLAVLLHPDGMSKATDSPLASELRKAGWDLVTVDLRATGQSAVESDRIRHAVDHNSAQWSVWIGRPLLGQWVWDVSRLLDALEQSNGMRPKQTAVLGIGSSAVVALTAAALDPRITQVATVDVLSSYVSDKPFRNQRMGIIVPGILRDVGDIQHMAALVAPRRLVVAGCVTGNGNAVKPAVLSKQFHYTQSVYALLKAKQKLSLFAPAESAKIVAELDR